MKNMARLFFHREINYQTKQTHVQPLDEKKSHQEMLSYVAVPHIVWPMELILYEALLLVCNTKWLTTVAIQRHVAHVRNLGRAVADVRRPSEWDNTN